MSLAEKVAGKGKRKQPNRFEDSEELLAPLIKAKNDAHLSMIQCNTSTNQKEFRRHQRKVKVAVNNAKEEWIARVPRKGKLKERMAAQGGRVS